MNEQLKRLIFAVIIVATFTGCAMSNDEIIQEAKKCEAAGMDYQVIHNQMSYVVVHVQCVPKKEACGK